MLARESRFKSPLRGWKMEKCGANDRRLTAFFWVDHVADYADEPAEERQKLRVAG
jgi:hypothetical protein